jgi:hypothetical protein
LQALKEEQDVADETTTTPEADASSGGQTIGGVSVDDQGNAIPGEDETDDETTTDEPSPKPAAEEVDDTPTPQPQNDLDDETKAWAEKKGLDLTDPAALAKSLREAERMAHSATQKRSELEAQLTQPSQNDGYDDLDQLKAEMAQLKASTAITQFYLNNPEAKELDEPMGKMVTENPGLKAAFDQGLLTVQDLFLMAKGSKGADDLKLEGGKEALQSAAKKLRASAPTAAASTPEQAATLSDEVITKMSDEEYRRRQPEIDAWLQAGGR